VTVPIPKPEEPPAPIPPTEGNKGADGKNGRGIESLKIVEGSLVVTYTDGNVVNLGRVKGDAGPSRTVTVIFQDSAGKQLAKPVVIPPNKSVVRVPIKRVVLGSGK
jgi:hypothetical protein